jgi:hypothetical protein
MLDNEKEINLNLKIPPEQSDGSFSMRDLVLTLYNGRKIFFICCFAGLLLGIIAAAGYYATNSSGAPSVAGDTSITLTLNYPGAEKNFYPNGAEYNVNLFYEIDLWERALRAVGRDNITPADAMGEVRIARQTPRLDENGHPIEEILNTSFIVTIPAGSTVFSDKSEKDSFLSAFGEEYKNSINSRYFTDSNAGILWNQQLRKWNESSREIIWDSFSFEQNLSLLYSRYELLADLLESLFDTDPLYRTPGGRSFNDFANDFREIYGNEIRLWTAKLNENIYIRNIDRFRSEYQFRIDSMKINRDFSMEIVDSYNELLSSFQSKDTSNGTVKEAIDMLTSAQTQADTASDLQRQIRQMEYNAGMLENNEQSLRNNSREAEAALTAFIEDLERNQEELTGIIFDYYKQLNERFVENSVLATTPVSQMPEAVAGVSMTRVLMLFVGLTFVGFVIGFCGAFVKKYLPEKGKNNKA